MYLCELDKRSPDSKTYLSPCLVAGQLLIDSNKNKSVVKHDPHMQVKRRLGPKGQIVIPKDIREMLGVKPGNEIILEVTGSEVIIRPLNRPDTYFERFGNTSSKLTKPVDIKTIIEDEHR